MLRMTYDYLQQLHIVLLYSMIRMSPPTHLDICMSYSIINTDSIFYDWHILYLASFIIQVVTLFVIRSRFISKSHVYTFEEDLWDRGSREFGVEQVRYTSYYYPITSVTTQDAGDPANLNFFWSNFEE